jgi:hypothetical protein
VEVLEEMAEVVIMVQVELQVLVPIPSFEHHQGTIKMEIVEIMGVAASPLLEEGLLPPFPPPAAATGSRLRHQYPKPNQKRRQHQHLQSRSQRRVRRRVRVFMRRRYSTNISRNTCRTSSTIYKTLSNSTTSNSISSLEEDVVEVLDVFLLHLLFLLQHPLLILYSPPMKPMMLRKYYSRYQNHLTVWIMVAIVNEGVRPSPLPPILPLETMTTMK